MLCNPRGEMYFNKTLLKVDLLHLNQKPYQIETLPETKVMGAVMVTNLALMPMIKLCQ